jgi:cytoskeletal protein RodZ
MYEQEEAPTLRRRLWLGMWFVIIALVLWALVWLLFFRGSTPDKTLHGSNTSQNQTSNNSTNTKNTGGSSGTNSTSGSSNTATTTPDNLANTGPGNVVAVVAGSAVAGTALYYVRLRKKLQA